MPFTNIKFIAICLHCLDMRDFHSELRDTPFLDLQRSRSCFIPMGRGQGHHQGDSLNAEMTGIWSARQSDSLLDGSGYRSPKRAHLAKTVIERLQEHGYDILTCIGVANGMGTWAVQGGMRDVWLREEPDRMKQFNLPGKMTFAEWLSQIRNSNKFYAHVFLRETHRPWAQEEEVYGLLGSGSKLRRWYRKLAKLPTNWPYDAYCARRAALECPDEFAALRRRGLARADSLIAEIFDATKDIEGLVYLIYSNHGEVFDHFRYNQAYQSSIVDGLKMIEGTSHGNYPYEVLYANMQMWIIPGLPPRTMQGIGRSIDIAPTILDLADAGTTKLDGESMLAYFKRGAFPDRIRFAESPIAFGCLSMVREDGLKLVAIGGDASRHDTVFAQRGFGSHRLAAFDLKADPYEYVNVIDTPQGRELLKWAITTHRDLKRDSGDLVRTNRD